MTEFKITEWTIDGDEAHAHIVGKNDDGEHVEEVTLSRAHDAPGLDYRGTRRRRLRTPPNHALQKLEQESLDADDDEGDEHGGAGHVNEPTKPYGGQAPFSHLDPQERNDRRGVDAPHRPAGRLGPL